MANKDNQKKKEKDWETVRREYAGDIFKPSRSLSAPLQLAHNYHGSTVVSLTATVVVCVVLS